jgi:ankyrin repeat protein
MKSTIASLFVLAVLTLAAGARLVGGRSYSDLDKMSDIIVVATPVSTRDTDEKTILHGISPDVHVVGLSSEFETVVVLKGDKSLKKLVVHHYRLENPKQLMGNAPLLASFKPKESTRYLLFLQREPDGRYAPFDQIDPAWTSILKLRGSEWDQMSPDTFKNWMDAKRWLREGPISEAPNLSGISPEISPEGRAEDSLHEAAMNGKLDKARALLKANPDLVFSHASYGSLTPLQFAAEYGHKDVAELLLANKAEVEAKSYGDWTPLLSAVFGGHKDLVELLLKDKANVNYKEQAGRSALHVAAENGYTGIAALLLANQADVNATNRDGLTPLHLAVALGHKDLMELLLTNNADVNAKDNRSMTPLGFAVLHNYRDLAESLREHGGKE